MDTARIEAPDAQLLARAVRQLEAQRPPQPADVLEGDAVLRQVLIYQARLSGGLDGL